MYVPGQALYSALKEESIDRRTAVVAIGEGLGALTLGLYELLKPAPEAHAGQKDKVQLKPDMPNTLTYTNEQGLTEIVPDLKGIWYLNILEEGQYYHQQARFEQDKNRFSAYKYKSGIRITDGMECIKGTLTPNEASFAELYIRETVTGWEKAKGTIFPDLNKMSLNCASVSEMLERKKL